MLEGCKPLAIALALSFLAACAEPVMDAGGPGTTGTTAIGKVFVDANGMTLYTYDLDGPEKSNCSGLCAVAWPPVKAAPNAKPIGRFNLIPRSDGSKQWAYDDKPLYGYVSDTNPGDIKGDGADGVWHVAKP